MKITVYEQDCWGKTHWRVMRDDGQRIFDCHHLDFPTLEEATAAIEGECRRKKLGEAKINVKRRKPDGDVEPAISSRRFGVSYDYEA